jgi:hypothetical protein
MVKVIITPNDIKVGKRKSGGYCPCAYALKRVFRRNDVTVHRGMAFIGCYHVELPPHIEKWIEDFDQKTLVHSVSFDLADPPADLEHKSDAA